MWWSYRASHARGGGRLEVVGGPGRSWPAIECRALLSELLYLSWLLNPCLVEKRVIGRGRAGDVVAGESLKVSAKMCASAVAAAPRFRTALFGRLEN